MTVERQFDGRVVLVTGAGSGIGQATAIELAKRGAKVGLLSKSESRVGATVAEIERAGGTALALPADVTIEQDLIDTFATLDGRWGRLDGVVVNAGISGVGHRSPTSRSKTGTRRSRQI